MRWPMTENPNVSEQPQRWTMSVPAAGRILGLGKSSAYEAARRDEIPTIRIGGRLIVSVRALENLLSVEPGSLMKGDANTMITPASHETTDADQARGKVHDHCPVNDDPDPIKES